MPAPQAPASPTLFCITCGYNQQGITSGRCPECGQDFSILAPSPTRLPWLHRRHLGLLRSYCRTVLMVLLRPKLFCDQIDNPITLKDARSFWFLTVAFACIPLLGAAVQIYHTPTQPLSLLRGIQSRFAPLHLALFMFGMILFITFATGMPSYFCHPRVLSIERQNRAIALSYFASAPLALMPFILSFMLLAQVSSQFAFISITFQFLAVLAAGFMLGGWYIQTVRIVLSLSQRRRRILTAFALTCAWVLVAGFTLIMVPIALWYITRTMQILF